MRPQRAPAREKNTREGGGRNTLRAYSPRDGGPRRSERAAAPIVAVATMRAVLDRAGGQGERSTSDALIPPKPKEFDSAVVGPNARPCSGT